MIVIQHIKVIWTKKTRGGKGAAVRNGVPQAFALLPVSSDADCALQSVRCEEHLDFQPVCAREAPVTQFPANWRCLGLSLSKDRFDVRFRWSPAQCGAPERHDFDAFSLAKGDWSRLVCNGRSSDSVGHWYYQLDTYNIAFTEGFSAGLFLDTAPKRETSLLASLK
ncbi:MAG: hypothetical protein OER56_06880 [Hyphomicrobiales bacterium]|nr:hypothetical protein [Hyphomicrobiales bacterium]